MKQAKDREVEVIPEGQVTEAGSAPDMSIFSVFDRYLLKIAVFPAKSLLPIIPGERPAR